MTAPLVPFIVPRGSPEYPRFLITEPYCQFWSGTLWSPHEREGLLFSDLDEATAEAQDLLREQFADKPHRTDFLVPILIEVMGEAPVSKEATVDWLRRVLTFEINYCTHGTGPTLDSCVLVSLLWPAIKDRSELK